MSGLSDNRSILLNGGYLLAARLLSRILRIVYLFVLARQFGPELFGQLTYANFWLLLFLPLANFGTNRLLTQLVGADRRRSAEHLSSTFNLRLLTSIGSALASLVLVLLIPVEPLARDLLLIFTASLLVRSWATWTQHAFIAVEDSRRAFVQELLFRTLEVVAGLLAVSLGAGILCIAWIYFASWALQALFGWLLVNRHVAKLGPRWLPGTFAELSLTGIAFMLFGQAQAFLEQGGLIIIKQIAADAMMLGQLALVLQILSSLLMAPKAIASAALPVLSRLVAGGGGGEIQSVTLILRMSILGAAGIALLGGSIAPWLLIMLLGDQYRVAAEWTGPGLWLLLPLATGALLNQLISAHRRYWNAALSAICGAVVMLGTILALTKVNPLPAVLLGMAAGGFGWTLIGAWQAVRVGGLNLAHAFGRPLIAVALANVMYWLVAQQSELLGLLVACGVLVLGLAPPQSLWTALRRRLGTDG